MSAGKKARAARSPRAGTPKAPKAKKAAPERPWYAPKPRWYADQVTPGGFGSLMRRDATPYVARVIATCDSLYLAKQLAAALNRGERDAGTVEELRGALRGAADRSEALYLALRRLVDAVRETRKPTYAKRAAARLAVAMIEAGRVLGDEPTFEPGGQEVAR